MRYDLSIFPFVDHAFSARTKSFLPSLTSHDFLRSLTLKAIQFTFDVQVYDLCLVNFCIHCEIKIGVHLFVYGCQIAPAKFVVKATFSP